jgi:two-component system NarL family response regulator
MTEMLLFNARRVPEQSGYVANGLVRDELLNAIRTVSKGGKHIPAAIVERLVQHMSGDTISAREVQALQLVAEGKRNEE